MNQCLRRGGVVLATVCLAVFGCDDSSSSGGGSGDGAVSPDVSIAEAGAGDAAGMDATGGLGGAGGGGGNPMGGAAGGGEDSGGGPGGAGGSQPGGSMGPLPDLGGAGGSAPPADAGPPPDVGSLDGDPCDPRLNAVACGPGFFCVHVPGQQPHIGRCQAADGCRPGFPEDCPDPERPYCHLKGGGTFCAAAGLLEEGEACLNDLDIPQPCAEGLLCDNSVCHRGCDPEGAAEECEGANARCADISEAIGAAAGLCMPPACNFFDGDGCEDGQKCGYAIRGDGAIVGACFQSRGDNGDGAPCSGFPEGGDNCGQGLLCVGPPDQEKFCRLLCDTAGYQAACPAGTVCQERLATRDGPVRGLGICVVNQ